MNGILNMVNLDRHKSSESFKDVTVYGEEGEKRL